MSKKTTLERAYLHINNGGLTFSVIERVDVRKDDIILPPDWHKRGPIDISPEGQAERDAALAQLPRQDMTNRRWVFQIETHHFGARTAYSFPIVPLTVRWMIGALQRVLTRMETPLGLPTDGIEHAFADKDNVHVTAIDGQQVDGYWPVPRETHSYGSGQKE